MKVSAGVAIVLNKEKVLLCHPSNASWGTNYSFPKGGVDIGEGILDAAMRELREETSVIVSKSQIKNPLRSQKYPTIFSLILITKLYHRNLMRSQEYPTRFHELNLKRNMSILNIF